MVNIEELIADARAEEQLAREPRIQALPVMEPQVTITLREYTELINKAQDHERIIAAIMADVKYSEVMEGLTLTSDRVLTTFRVLYPNLYEEMERKAK